MIINGKLKTSCFGIQNWSWFLKDIKANSCKPHKILPAVFKVNIRGYLWLVAANEIAMIVDPVTAE
jgi:hypothetical protein